MQQKQTPDIENDRDGTNCGCDKGDPAQQRQNEQYPGQQGDTGSRGAEGFTSDNPEADDEGDVRDPEATAHQSDRFRGNRGE